MIDDLLNYLIAIIPRLNQSANIKESQLIKQITNFVSYKDNVKKKDI